MAEGYVSTHRTKRAAYRSLAEDTRRCMRAGTPSDAQVYRWRDGWVLEEQILDVELVEVPERPGDSAADGTAPRRDRGVISATNKTVLDTLWAWG